MFIKVELFIKGVANALRHAPLDLSLQDHRVDDAATVVYNHIFFDFDHQRL